MSRDFSTANGRDGAFRSLIMSVENKVAFQVSGFWDGLPELREQWNQELVELNSPQISSKAFLRDLLFLMIAEHAEFRRRIQLEYGSFENAEHRPPGRNAAAG